MTLKEVCGEELYAQVEEKLNEINAKITDKVKHVRFTDLSEGNYVSKEKFDTKVTELKGVQQQLTDANNEIQSYKDMDIEGVKKSAQEWEEKYNTDTQALKDQIAQQERSHQTDRYLDTVGIKPGAMYREFVKKAFEAKEFKMDGDKFLGADDFIASLKTNPDYKDAFVQEGTPGGDGTDTQIQNDLPAGTPAEAPGTIPGTALPGAEIQKPLPQFATGTSGAGVAAAGNQNPFMSFGFTDVRPRPSGNTNQ
ncbi:MAG: hypothetical protein HDR09_12965 [Lachnospiraceae bacterium]|nr:hypothetical protein [Lachnospiraceae bacterium]